MKDKHLISPKTLDVFGGEWWLSKTLDEDKKTWTYSFSWCEPNQMQQVYQNEVIANTADQLAKKIGKLIREKGGSFQ